MVRYIKGSVYSGHDRFIIHVFAKHQYVLATVYKPTMTYSWHVLAFNSLTELTNYSISGV